MSNLLSRSLQALLTAFLLTLYSGFVVADTDIEQLTASILSLGTTLGLDIVAEGVETEEQVARLQELGCRRMQGYLFGKPMPAKDLRELLARQSERISVTASTAS